MNNTIQEGYRLGYLTGQRPRMAREHPREQSGDPGLAYSWRLSKTEVRWHEDRPLIGDAVNISVP